MPAIPARPRYESSGGTQRRFRVAHLARRYTQDVAVAADDGNRRRGHRRQNLFARVGRSLERVAGASDKRQHAMARRRCAALPPPRLSSRHVCGECAFRARLCHAVRSKRKKFCLDFQRTFALVSRPPLPPDCAAPWQGPIELLSYRMAASKRIAPPRGQPGSRSATTCTRRRSCLTLDTLSSSTRTNG